MIKDIGHIEILKTSPGSSIQDKGRNGLGRYGIPISGVMDLRSFEWINHLLQNKANAAVIEILQPGFKCLFDSHATVGLGGAKAEIFKNGEPISDTLVKINPGDELEIGKFKKGGAIYLGISHGIQSEEVLNSRSFFSNLTKKGMLAKGDKIPYFTTHDHGSLTFSKVKEDHSWMDKTEIEVYPGPDFEELTPESKAILFNSLFTISNLANRMAYQLEALLPNEIPEKFTAPVYPGTVQLTSGGKLLLLMRDAQVTGGYPRILQLTTNSLNLLAQKKTGDSIQFKLKSLTLNS